MKRTSLLFACLVLVFGQSLPAARNAQAAPTQQEIESAVLRAMEEFQVPGMAVSVVYDGALYYSAGHGLVETGKTKGWVYRQAIGRLDRARDGW